MSMRRIFMRRVIIHRFADDSMIKCVQSSTDATGLRRNYYCVPDLFSMLLFLFGIQLLLRARQRPSNLRGSRSNDTSSRRDASRKWGPDLGHHRLCVHIYQSVPLHFHSGISLSPFKGGNSKFLENFVGIVDHRGASPIPDNPQYRIHDEPW